MRKNADIAFLLDKNNKKLEDLDPRTCQNQWPVIDNNSDSVSFDANYLMIVLADEMID